MTGIVDLDLERAKREGPDPDCTKHDQWGRQMFLFGIDYKMDDAYWTAHLWAYSWGDAEARVAAMRGSLVVSRKISAIIPA